MPAPFNPDDDVDAIADLVRREIADALLRVTRARRYRKASPAARAEGMIHGTMVGALGGIAAQCFPEAAGELRATLLAHFPYYFDRGLEIGGREPLGDVN